MKLLIVAIETGNEFAHEQEKIQRIKVPSLTSRKRRDGLLSGHSWESILSKGSKIFVVSYIDQLLCVFNSS